ncbi:unnamed protein product [Paramecium octaurelia]|uniref:Uncharacterized protein n=1 Tax=Paramecium octaurelia TaxID=43137 RepID=A0A8S1TV25_PAROT|nr:unnamed protein product [Paramecium octaurelia]
MEDQKQIAIKKVFMNSVSKWEGTWDTKILYWDEAKGNFMKMKLQILLTKHKELIYQTQSGFVLRIDYAQEILEQPKIMTNLEQLKFLQWHGQIGQDNKRQGKWTATWDGEIIAYVGGMYCHDGKKQGLWKELIENFWSRAQVFEVGSYQNDEKIGLWKYIQKEKNIGSGLYNEQGQKDGKWTELFENFFESSQVFYQGIYREGIKIGKWIIIWKDEEVGWGNYENNEKNGLWIELSKEFQQDSQVTYAGLYQNGKKINRWNTYYNQKKIGGGFYDDCFLKHGKWIDLIENFSNDRQITLIGLYNKGQKVGIWDWEELSHFSRFKKISGGLYNGQGQKNGIWYGLTRNYSYISEITSKGKYKNGKKIGNWNLFFLDKQIGGGEYNEKSLKNGNWIEVDDFWVFCESSLQGEYLNGIKIGKWIIKWEGKQLGGGQYDENNLKNGKWIELSQAFYEDSQVTHAGLYQNGKKVGRWNIYYNNKKIGGGSFDECCLKHGKWIDLIDNFHCDKEVTVQGEYLNGRKIGNWVYILNHKQIGGGLYDHQSQKQGKWVELSTHFCEVEQETNQGVYQNGLKIGKWISLKKGFEKQSVMEY